MELIKKWEELSNTERSKKESDEFWNEYLAKETSAYKIILSEKKDTISGTVSQVAESLELETVNLIGFIDGINTSLKEEIDIDNLEEDTEIKMQIDFEKLHYNMHKAKANWLYGLEEWDDILSAEQRNEIKKDYNRSQIVISNKIGRNDDCPCGSGKKYKKCCINKD